MALRPVEFHILLTLAGEERHGYAILQEVAELTDGELAIEPGGRHPAARPEARRRARDRDVSALPGAAPHAARRLGGRIGAPARGGHGRRAAALLPDYTGR